MVKHIRKGLSMVVPLAVRRPPCPKYQPRRSYRTACQSTACPHLFAVRCWGKILLSCSAIAFRFKFLSLTSYLVLPCHPVLPSKLLRDRQVLGMFNWDEVERLVCGKPEVDVDLLEVLRESVPLPRAR